MGVVIWNGDFPSSTDVDGVACRITVEVVYLVVVANDLVDSTAAEDPAKHLWLSLVFKLVRDKEDRILEKAVVVKAWAGRYDADPASNVKHNMLSFIIFWVCNLKNGDPWINLSLIVFWKSENWLFKNRNY